MGRRNRGAFPFPAGERDSTITYGAAHLGGFASTNSEDSGKARKWARQSGTDGARRVWVCGPFTGDHASLFLQGTLFQGRNDLDVRDEMHHKGRTKHPRKKTCQRHTTDPGRLLFYNKKTCRVLLDRRTPRTRRRKNTPSQGTRASQESRVFQAQPASEKDRNFNQRTAE